MQRSLGRAPSTRCCVSQSHAAAVPPAPPAALQASYAAQHHLVPSSKPKGLPACQAPQSHSQLTRQRCEQRSAPMLTSQLRRAHLLRQPLQPRTSGAHTLSG